MSPLATYLASLPEGCLSSTSELESLLAEQWHEIEGADQEGMAGYKIRGRMERVDWHPPVLTFVIERHGGTVRGSSRATVQRWAIDVEGNTATCESIGHRQIEKAAPRLDVRPLASAVGSAIIAGRVDERLERMADGTVRVSIGKIIPNSGPKQTVEGRRMRFREALDGILLPAGWMKVRANKYRPPPTSGS